MLICCCPCLECLHGKSKVIRLTIFHKKLTLFFLCLSTEHPRIELVDGALLDLFCSMYSVSCKVVNFHHYFHQHFLSSPFLLKSDGVLSPDFASGSELPWSTMPPYSKHQSLITLQ